MIAKEEQKPTEDLDQTVMNQTALYATALDISKDQIPQIEEEQNPTQREEEKESTQEKRPDTYDQQREEQWQETYKK